MQLLFWLQNNKLADYQQVTAKELEIYQFVTTRRVSGFQNHLECRKFEVKVPVNQRICHATETKTRTKQNSTKVSARNVT